MDGNLQRVFLDKFIIQYQKCRFFSNPIVNLFFGTEVFIKFSQSAAFHSMVGDSSYHGNSSF